jgi:hypothetical protein
MKKGNRLRSQMRQRLTQRKTFFSDANGFVGVPAYISFAVKDYLHMFDVAMQAQQKSFL